MGRNSRIWGGGEVHSIDAYDNKYIIYSGRDN